VPLPTAPLESSPVPTSLSLYVLDLFYDALTENDANGIFSQGTGSNNATASATGSSNSTSSLKSGQFLTTSVSSSVITSLSTGASTTATILSTSTTDIVSTTSSGYAMRTAVINSAAGLVGLLGVALAF
jgi:hypothetical protein